MICPCCGLADETHNDLYCRIDNFGTCSAWPVLARNSEKSGAAPAWVGVFTWWWSHRDASANCNIPRSHHRV